METEFFFVNGENVNVNVIQSVFLTRQKWLRLKFYNNEKGKSSVQFLYYILYYQTDKFNSVFSTCL